MHDGVGAAVEQRAHERAALRLAPRRAEKLIYIYFKSHTLVQSEQRREGLESRFTKEAQQRSHASFKVCFLVAEHLRWRACLRLEQ